LEMAEDKTGGPSFSVAVIVNARGQILFLQRSPSAALGPGQWGFPGGKLEAGEDPVGGMERELREELGDGIRMQREAVLGPVPAEGLPGGLIYLFRYRWLGGAIVISSEHSRFAWVDAATFPSLDVMAGVRADLAYFGLWNL
jgi:8-oxo-dGTP pyrophosphatase MutT (NUDIX family)